MIFDLKFTVGDWRPFCAITLYSATLGGLRARPLHFGDSRWQSVGTACSLNPDLYRRGQRYLHTHSNPVRAARWSGPPVYPRSRFGDSNATAPEFVAGCTATTGN